MSTDLTDRPDVTDTAEDPAGPEPGVAARILPVAAVVAAVLALVFGALWLFALNSDPVRVAEARDDVLRDARQAVVNLNTLDHDDAQKGLDLWIQSSSGSVRDEFEKNRDAYARLVTQQRRTTAATVADAAVAEVDPRAGTARVLAGVDVTVTPEGAEPTVTRQRIELGMVETPDGWKVDALEPLTTPGSGG
ncbi:hypothetical protein [Pseudonocardia sp. HH130630-07]|uniref:hypothetical protein n=1 Tax=Pseudonocardia sp. HH130630-07 TaxID=1690815 RepID=UPI000814EB27|nr:hypothetical protein [Pseudonocardia sp. HH130630-07]ANY07389.1 hypothetical protein AFB00_15055 [Pseudonocardia sp. HH130630-07]